MGISVTKKEWRCFVDSFVWLFASVFGVLLPMLIQLMYSQFSKTHPFSSEHFFMDGSITLCSSSLIIAISLVYYFETKLHSNANGFVFIMSAILFAFNLSLYFAVLYFPDIDTGEFCTWQKYMFCFCCLYSFALKWYVSNEAYLKKMGGTS